MMTFRQREHEVGRFTAPLTAAAQRPIECVVDDGERFLRDLAAVEYGLGKARQHRRPSTAASSFGSHAAPQPRPP